MILFFKLSCILLELKSFNFKSTYQKIVTLIVYINILIATMALLFYL